MAGSLEFIKSASGTSVSTLDVTDCFSADYDVYKIVTSKVDLVSNGYQRIRFISSGGVDSSSVYDTAFLELTAYTGFSSIRFTNDDKIYYWNYSGNASSHIGGSVLYVFNPYDSSSYTFMKCQSATNSYQPAVGVKSIGVQKVAQQVTGFALGFGSTYTFTNITVNVYGVK